MRRLLQVGAYLVSGSLYFWSGYALFAVLWSGFGWQLWWAKFAANVFGWSVNYTLQRFWVFGQTMPAGRRRQASGRYVVITFVDFILDYLIVAGFKRIGISPYASQFISAGAMTVWNYYWYRFWVFPEQQHGKRR
jgi:putative flippase GtrA